MRRQYEWHFTAYLRKAIEANPELDMIYGRLGRFKHLMDTNPKMNLNECCLLCGSCDGCDCSD